MLRFTGPSLCTLRLGTRQPCEGDAKSHVAEVHKDQCVILTLRLGSLTKATLGLLSVKSMRTL
jgi:hypothetical protein